MRKVTCSFLFCTNRWNLISSTGQRCCGDIPRCKTYVEEHDPPLPSAIMNDPSVASARPAWKDIGYGSVSQLEGGRKGCTWAKRRKKLLLLLLMSTAGVRAKTTIKRIYRYRDV